MACKQSRPRACATGRTGLPKAVDILSEKNLQNYLSIPLAMVRVLEIHELLTSPNSKDVLKTA